MCHFISTLKIINEREEMPCVSGTVWAVIIQIVMFYNNYWGVQLYTLLRTLNLANLVTTPACFFAIILFMTRRRM